MRLTSGSYIPLLRRAMNLHNRSFRGPAMNPSSEAIRPPIPKNPNWVTVKLYGASPKIKARIPINTDSHADVNPVTKAYSTAGNNSNGIGLRMILRRLVSDSIPRQGRSSCQNVHSSTIGCGWETPKLSFSRWCATWSVVPKSILRSSARRYVDSGQKKNIKMVSKARKREAKLEPVEGIPTYFKCHLPAVRFDNYAWNNSWSRRTDKYRKNPTS